MNWWTESYPSGTIIVKSDIPLYPHYYIWQVPEDNDSNHKRQRVAKELTLWLNGIISKPYWLEVKEVKGASAVLKSGQLIQAVGPMVDRNPPQLDWTEDDSEFSRRARQKLIDVLYFGTKLLENEQ
jgi:hypothetical protein